MSNYEQYQQAKVKTPTLTIWQSLLSAPAVATFSRYLPETDMMRAILWLILGTLTSTVINMITTALGIGMAGRGQMMRMLRSGLPPEIMRELPANLPGLGSFSIGAALCGIPTIIIISLVLTFISVGFIHLVAKLFQGQGNYAETFFLTSAVTAPIMIVTAVLQLVSGLFRLIPLAGVVLSLLISLLMMAMGIYSLVLTAMAVAAAHRFSLGKGFLATILPTVLFLLFICCCVFIAIFAAGSAIDQGTIDEIMRQMSAYLILQS